MSMIICIVGPTGVGKTKLSIELAKKLGVDTVKTETEIKNIIKSMH